MGDNGRELYESYSLTMNGYLRGMMAGQRSMMANYPMQEMDVGAKVYVPIVEERHFERGETLIADFIAELQGLASAAPEGCEAVIEFEQDYGYDDDRITVLKVGYWRDPTPDERAEREAHNSEALAHNAELAKRKAAQVEAEEREEFERLSAKYARSKPERP